MRRLITIVIILALLLVAIRYSQQFLPANPQLTIPGTENKIDLPGSTDQGLVTDQEKIVINVVKKTAPSVVTIAATSQELSAEDDPFGFFRQQPSDEPRNIASGFIISKDGFVVSNKHVVSNSSASYFVVANNKKRYPVQRVYRDPLNDIAILKIDPKGDTLTPLPLGDSAKLQVGQTVIAIGTSLGQFNNSVTTGVISGLGRGITAGDPFEGFAEELDDVIQTDAAINPGNSGGPLLNASGQAIGVNTAVSQSGQNIGFALPINVIKTSLQEFNNTGQFNRPFLGVSYRMISRDLSLRAEVPQGAYVESVVSDSSAAKGGIQSGDIITEFDGTKLSGENAELSTLIAKKKVGDTIKVKVYRENASEDLTVTLEAAPEQ